MKRLDIRAAIGIAISIIGIIFVVIAGISRVAHGDDTISWAINMFEQFAIGVVTIGAALLIVDVNITRYEKASSQKDALANRKKNLLLQLHCRINTVAARASEELAENGWLRDGTLSGINLDGANLGNTFFASANFSKTSLEHVTATNADWREANLDNAELSFANMSGSDLTAAKFTNAEMVYTNLENTFLDSADFRGANLDSANLKNAHLFGVIRYWNEIDGDSITYSAAKFDQSTVLPDGLLWNESTDMHRFTNPDHPNFFIPQPKEPLDVNL